MFLYTVVLGIYLVFNKRYKSFQRWSETQELNDMNLADLDVEI